MPIGRLRTTRPTSVKTRAIPAIGRNARLAARASGGVSTGGWTSNAQKIQEAGADALELNIYYIPTDPEMAGSQVEQRYVELARHVKAAVSIPVAVKLGHAFSAMANVARQLDQAGVGALVLFNRFYQPDFDLESLKVVPQPHAEQPL
jgi:dihydroorotate dehydrogenase (fumarate)